MDESSVVWKKVTTATLIEIKDPCTKFDLTNVRVPEALTSLKVVDWHGVAVPSRLHCFLTCPFNDEYPRPFADSTDFVQFRKDLEAVASKKGDDALVTKLNPMTHIYTNDDLVNSLSYQLGRTIGPKKHQEEIKEEWGISGFHLSLPRITDTYIETEKMVVEGFSVICEGMTRVMEGDFYGLIGSNVVQQTSVRRKVKPFYKASGLSCTCELSVPGRTVRVVPAGTVGSVVTAGALRSMTVGDPGVPFPSLGVEENPTEPFPTEETPLPPTSPTDNELVSSPARD